MASETTKKILKEVRPILSLNKYEAKRRVITLYRAFYRQIPYIYKYYDTEFSEAKCRNKLREEFTKYAKIEDIRIIDMLVIKGQMTLNEIAENWTTKRVIAGYLTNNNEKKSENFLTKFYDKND